MAPSNRNKDTPFPTTSVTCASNVGTRRGLRSDSAIAGPSSASVTTQERSSGSSNQRIVNEQNLRSPTTEAGPSSLPVRVTTGRPRNGKKGKRVHLCASCNKIYSRKEHLERHHRSSHEPPSRFCSRCSKPFNRPDLLARHESQHNSPNSPLTRTNSNQSMLTTEAPGRSDPNFSLPIQLFDTQPPDNNLEAEGQLYYNNNADNLVNETFVSDQFYGIVERPRLNSESVVSSSSGASETTQDYPALPFNPPFDPPYSPPDSIGGNQSSYDHQEPHQHNLHHQRQQPPQFHPLPQPYQPQHQHPHQYGHQDLNFASHTLPTFDDEVFQSAQNSFNSQSSSTTLTGSMTGTGVGTETYTARDEPWSMYTPHSALPLTRGDNDAENTNTAVDPAAIHMTGSSGADMARGGAFDARLARRY